MRVGDQMTALAERGMGAGDSARYWRTSRYNGLECLAARFASHKYTPHTHDSYVVGAIVSGCETFVVRGERRYARAGDVCFVHPGEVHDGEPHGDSYAYRMSYPRVELLTEIAGELIGRPSDAAPYFPEPTVHDPVTAAMFAEAHRGLGLTDALYGDERYVAVMARLLARYARLDGPGPVGTEAGPVARVQAYLDAHYADNVELSTLADVARVSRFHLIRAFRKHTGLTPHAWLADRRVKAARAQLAAGKTPGEVAASCGFADQSHLTRAFKARVGVTPGRFRAANMDLSRRDAA
jgi:AraC-like DNA-binding protein